MNQVLKSLKLLARMNWFLTLVIVALLTLGVLFIYSSCYINEDQAVRTLYQRQLLWIGVGLVCYFGFAALDYRSLRRLSWWAYAGCMLLLILVLFVGAYENGARRRLVFLGVGLQPSELAKLAAIVVLARKLGRPGENLGHVRPLVDVLLIVALPFLLILKEPDLGTALVFLPTAFLIMFAGGVPLKPLGLLVLVGVLGGGTLLGALLLPDKLGVDEEGQKGIMRRIGVSEYQRERLMVFLRPDRDPLGAGWNKRQSEIAVGSGGAWGKGFLKGTQNILGFLPRSVAPTDFIYSVIAEETGFSGSVVVLLLFGLTAIFGVQAGLASRDKLGRLLCVGVVSMIFCHVFVNIAMTVGLVPITGLPLPLLSYGGSFMVVMMSALGIVQSVYIRSRHAEVVFEQRGLWGG